MNEPAVLMEWVRYTQKTLDSIKKLTFLSKDRLSDREFGNFLNRVITEEIDQADLWLNLFLNYFHITTPLQKTNTVNTLLDEVIKKNQTQLEERGVELSKRFGEDLPEIIVPDEPLKYILNSALQYTIMSTPSKGTIKISTKSFTALREEGDAPACFEKFGGGVEITFVFIDERTSIRQAGAAEERNLSPQTDGSMKLMLRLIQDMVQRNRGAMNLEANENISEKAISLRFPRERRKLVCFEPVLIKPSDQPLNLLDN